MQISEEVLNQVADVLQKKFGFTTTSQLDKAILELLQKTDQRRAKGNTFSLSTMVRGLRAMRGEPLNPNTSESDIAYLRALATGSTPGSYLVPTIQADEIIQFLETGGIARASGVRVWPCEGIQKLTVPTALGAPSWVWMAQNSVQTATDPNLGQMAFDLKERRALIAVPNQLLQVSIPAFDVLLSELLGLGAAAHEDTAFFASSTVSNGPVALMSASGLSTLNCSGSANGGNLSYADILSVLAKMAAVKGRGPFCWYASPRTMYSRILGLLDLQSRPLYLPTYSAGLLQGPIVGSTQQPVGLLMGCPLYVSPYISETETLGSGSAQSHLIFCNPSYCHIAQDSSIEIAVSLERYFDSAQTAIRALQHEDFQFAPPQGVIVLQGVN